MEYNHNIKNDKFLIYFIYNITIETRVGHIIMVEDRVIEMSCDRNVLWSK